MTTARVCTHGSGPNVARCRAPDGHLEHTNSKPGKGRTRCPHRDADGTRCGTWSKVLSERQVAELFGLDLPGPGSLGTPLPDGRGLALTVMWAQMPEWDGEIFWREDEDAGACPYRGCGSSVPRLAEPSRTLAYCPACGKLGDYPEVTEWRSRQRAPGSARRQPTQAELSEQASQDDEKRRALKRARRPLLEQLERALADKRLTADARLDLEDFAEQAASAPSMERLGQIREQLAGYVIARRSLFARSAELDDYDENDDVIEGEIVDDDQDDESSIQAWRPAEVRALPGALTPGQASPEDYPAQVPPQLAYCAFCSAPAPLRVSAAMPTAQQLAAAGGVLPVTVCAECWPALQTAGGPGSWQVEDLTSSHRPGGIRLARAAASETRAGPGEPNPTIEISGYGPRRVRRIPA